ncbi:hypothetical protein GCM10009647_073920 [Streptomyces sanglieri]
MHALERFQGRGRTVLTASDATQYSFEGSQPHGEAAQSVFTRYLVAGLRDGSADLDGDGNINLDELYSYVHDRVVDEVPQQRPKKQDNVEGRIIIAQNIHWSLPPYLSIALDSPIPADRLTALDGLAHLHRIGNDVVRQHVTSAIQHLVDDDSRCVSSAAADQLQSIQAPYTPSELAAGHVPELPQPATETPTATPEEPRQARYDIQEARSTPSRPAKRHGPRTCSTESHVRTFPVLGDFPAACPAADLRRCGGHFAVALIPAMSPSNAAWSGRCGDGVAGIVDRANCGRTTW